MTVFEATYVGPLPTPSILAAYDKVMPGLAERIASQFEIEAAHRRRLEDQQAAVMVKVTQEASADVARGQTYGLIVTLALGLGGTLAVVFAPSAAAAWAGALLGGTGIAGTAAVFVLGRARYQQPPASQAKSAPARKAAGGG